MGVRGEQTLEHEADRIADEALAAPAAVGTRAVRSSRAAPAPARGAALRGGGTDRPGSGSVLEPVLRQDMERRLGFDFSTVRVHFDQGAQESALRLDALAYTMGRDVVFAPGQFAPGTVKGRRLIAHELVHVMQQRELSAADAPLQRRQPRDPDEVAAAAKEDAALTLFAKRALASGHPQMAVQEVMWRLIRAHRLEMHFELSGSHYDKAQKGVAVEMHGKGPGTTATLVAGDDALRRVANGQAAAIVREIEAQIARVGQARGTVDYVFIMGKDVSRTNKFYTEAKKYFKAEYPSAIMVEDVRNLDGINALINSEGKPVNDLIIVSHANADGTLQFSLGPKPGMPGRVQYSELKEANKEGALIQPRPELVGFWTNVLIRGCNLGRSEAMLSEMRTAFGGGARVIAPTHEQRYGGREESMAGPFYEVPGRSKLTNKEALKRLESKPEYGFVTNWKSMTRGLKREVDATTEEIWNGPFPEKGHELALLASTAKHPPVTAFKFAGCQVQGDKTLFTFEPKDKFKFGPVTIGIETPPTDAAAIQEARNRTARPEAYSYEVHRARRGLHLRVTVDVVRTEWVLYHQELHKAGRPFDPSPGTKPWFGDTGY